MRTINVSLSEILELVHCAEYYGFSHSVLLDALSTMVETLTDEEITHFATTSYLSEDARSSGYGEEDYEEAVRCLKEWKTKYFEQTT